jgi:hypothetical protein
MSFDPILNPAHLNPIRSSSNVSPSATLPHRHRRQKQAEHHQSDQDNGKEAPLVKEDPAPGGRVFVPTACELVVMFQFRDSAQDTGIDLSHSDVTTIRHQSAHTVHVFGINAAGNFQTPAKV